MRGNRAVKMKERAQSCLVDIAAAVRHDGLGLLVTKVSMKSIEKAVTNVGAMGRSRPC